VRYRWSYAVRYGGAEGDDHFGLEWEVADDVEVGFAYCDGWDVAGVFCACFDDDGSFDHIHFDDNVDNHFDDDVNHHDDTAGHNVHVYDDVNHHDDTACDDVNFDDYVNDDHFDVAGCWCWCGSCWCVGGWSGCGV
jgi:hypothetical protein